MPNIAPTASGNLTATWLPDELGLAGVVVGVSPAVLSTLALLAGWPAATLYYTVAGAGTVTVRLGIFDSFDPTEIQRRTVATAVGAGQWALNLAGADVYPAVRVALNSTSSNTVTAWIVARSR